MLLFHFHVFPSSSEIMTVSLYLPSIVSLHTSTQCPLFKTIPSALLPGFGISVYLTSFHVTPPSFDSLTYKYFGYGLLFLMYATSVPSDFKNSAGWMLAIPTIGSLKVHVLPQSSEMAIKDISRPSE